MKNWVFSAIQEVTTHIVAPEKNKVLTDLLQNLCNVVVAVKGAQLGLQDEAVHLVEHQDRPNILKPRLPQHHLQHHHRIEVHRIILCLLNEHND